MVPFENFLFNTSGLKLISTLKLFKMFKSKIHPITGHKDPDVE